MDSEAIIFIAVIIGIFVTTLFVSFKLGKRQNKPALTGLWLLWAGFTAIMFFGMQTAPGWDALGYAIALIGLSAPAGVGGLIGSIVGWAKKDIRQHEEPA